MTLESPSLCIHRIKYSQSSNAVSELLRHSLGIYIRRSVITAADMIAPCKADFGDLRSCCYTNIHSVYYYA